MNSIAFQFQYMALAINIKDGHGPSNEICHQLPLRLHLISCQHSSKRRLMHCILLAKRIMALANDTMHGHDPSNKMCTQLQLKKTEVRLYLAIDMAAKGFIRAVCY